MLFIIILVKDVQETWGLHRGREWKEKFVLFKESWLTRLSLNWDSWTIGNDISNLRACLKGSLALNITRATVIKYLRNHIKIILRPETHHFYEHVHLDSKAHRTWNQPSSIHTNSPFAFHLPEEKRHVEPKRIIVRCGRFRKILKVCASNKSRRNPLHWQVRLWEMEIFTARLDRFKCLTWNLYRKIWLSYRHMTNCRWRVSACLFSSLWSRCVLPFLVQKSRLWWRHYLQMSSVSHWFQITTRYRVSQVSPRSVPQDRLKSGVIHRALRKSL